MNGFITGTYKSIELYKVCGVCSKLHNSYTRCCFQFWPEKYSRPIENEYYSSENRIVRFGPDGDMDEYKIT